MVRQSVRWYSCPLGHLSFAGVAGDPFGQRYRMELGKSVVALVQQWEVASVKGLVAALLVPSCQLAHPRCTACVYVCILSSSTIAEVHRLPNMHLSKG